MNGPLSILCKWQSVEEEEVQDLTHSPKTVDIRVARWHLFKPKIPILECLGMEKVGIFYGQLFF
jgi:hypothetical protein